MADRAYDKNVGFISLPEVPDNVFIAGAIIVMIDEEGEYNVAFRAESLDKVPSEELQQEIASIVRSAWAIANTPGMAL